MVLGALGYPKHGETRGQACPPPSGCSGAGGALQLPGGIGLLLNQGFRAVGVWGTLKPKPS